METIYLSMGIPWYILSKWAIVHIDIQRWNGAGILFLPGVLYITFTRTFSHISLKIFKPVLGHDGSSSSWLTLNLTSFWPASLEVSCHKPKSVLPLKQEHIYDEGIGSRPFGPSHGPRCGWFWMFWPRRIEMGLENGRT